MAMERSTVVGVFHNRDDAERAIDELHRLGFRDEEIGFAVRGGDHITHETSDKSADAGSGALSGAIAGAGIGGFIAAAASLLIPGFGPVVAGGILATLLGGAAVGAAAGGILGALVGLGVPEEEARYYETEFHEGRVIVTVKAGARYNEARDVLFDHGAYDVERRGGMVGAGTGSTTGTGTTMGSSTTMGTGTMAGGTSSMMSHRGGWDDFSPRLRERWQTRYGTGGGRWEEYEPRYRYGYEMSNDSRFRDRNFDDVESDLRLGYGEWGQRSGHTFKDTDWDNDREYIRDAWDESRGTRRAA
jgi:hypothetical protein